MPEWQAEWLPDWARAMADGLMQPTVLAVLVVGSAALFVLSLIGLPMFLTRMPADFFSRHERRRIGLERVVRPPWLVALRGLKNVLGLVLLLLGFIMLLIPGQGLLTIFVGLVLLDFPGKRGLERWLISRPSVHRRINALRRHYSRPPLELPADASRRRRETRSG